MSKELTKRERERMQARADKLKPKPILTPSGAWRCQVLVDGKRRSITAATPEAAHAQAVALKAGFFAQVKKAPTFTVESAVKRYIETKEAVLSPSTVKGYKKIQSNLMEAIKDVPLFSLTQERVQRWVSGLSRNHAAKTVKNAHGLLTAVLAEYRPDFVLRTTLPQKDAKQVNIPTEDELKKMFAAVAGKDFELPFLLAVWMGLRASEIRGLRWEDVKDGRLHVCRAIVDGPDGPALKKTKTVSGDRWLKLPIRIQQLLDARPRRGEYIISLTSGAMYMRLYRLCDALSIPRYRFHDLRHTAASLAVVAGVPTKYSQQRMGHATDNMLRTVYEHTLRSKEDEYADLLNAYYETTFAL